MLHVSLLRDFRTIIRLKIEKTNKKSQKQASTQFLQNINPLIRLNTPSTPYKVLHLFTNTFVTLSLLMNTVSNREKELETLIRRYFSRQRKLNLQEQ